MADASELIRSQIAKNHIKVQKEKEDFVGPCLRPAQTCNYAFSHRSRSVTVKKCTQKRGALAELLFCVFNLLPF